MNDKRHSSYKSILKSTTFVGGGQIIVIIFQIIRRKILAVILGPSGIGLLGAYLSVINLVKKFSDLGIGTSSVRDISIAEASDNQIEISNVTITLRRITIGLGLIGTFLTIGFSSALSKFTFHSNKYALDICILSIIIFFNIVSLSQTALLQGKRKIKDLAKVDAISAVLATIIGIPIIIIAGIRGLIPYLIIISVSQFLASWWYARKIKVIEITLQVREILARSKGMIKLGIAFMAGGLLTTIGLYLINVIIINQIGIYSLGYYQASVTLSTVYIGVILNAMGKDFYPRLSSAQNDNTRSIQLINEQTEIGILIATPGLFLTLALAPIIITIFYSSKFSMAYLILRWQILGIFIRVIVWPMGYIFVARGKGILFFLCQLFFNIIYISLVFFFIKNDGIIGVGIAFSTAYLIYLFFMKYMAFKEIDFKWTKDLRTMIILFSVVILTSFLILLFTTELTGGICMTIVGMGLFYYSIKKMMNILEIGNYRELIKLVRDKVIN